MYAMLKVVHVAAAIIFLGNITTGIFWKTVADRSASVVVMRHTIAAIIRSDRLFTVPGVIVLVLAGFALAMVGRIPVLSTGWVLWSLVLFSIAGVAFIPVSRSQEQLLAALDANDGAADLASYRALSRQWDRWAAVALFTPVVALILMIAKPVLPALHR